MENFTRCKDVNGKEIYEGDTIRTQIDGRLPDWFEGKVVYWNGCYGLDVDCFEPMCWFMNMKIIPKKKTE